jgi:hypothetical protein
MAIRRGGSRAGAGHKSVLQRALDNGDIEDTFENQQELMFYNYCGIALPDSIASLATSAEARLRMTGAEREAHYKAAVERAIEIHERNKNSYGGAQRCRERIHRGHDAYKYTPPSWFTEPTDDDATD